MVGARHGRAGCPHATGRERGPGSRGPKAPASEHAPTEEAPVEEADALAPVDVEAASSAVEEYFEETVVVGTQLGAILDEIWENRHMYDPSKPVRPPVAKSEESTMRVDIPTQLAHLDKLRRQGVIDDEEFALAKSKVLNKQ